MGLGRDRSVRHCTGGKASDDFADRFDLVNVYGGSQVVAESEQTPERRQVPCLIVDHPGVLPEDVIATCPGCMLEAKNGLRVEQMVFTFTAPLVFTPHLEGSVRPLLGTLGIRRSVALGHLVGQDIEADTSQPAHRSPEATVDHLVTEANGLKDLGSRIGGHRGDAHLGHHLQDALVARPDEVLSGCLWGQRRG